MAEKRESDEYSSDDEPVPIAAMPARSYALKQALSSKSVSEFRKVNRQYMDNPQEGLIKQYRLHVHHDQECLRNPDYFPNIPVSISDDLDGWWKTYAIKAMSDIRTAAPGINIYHVEGDNDARIKIIFDPDNTQTVGDIWHPECQNGVEICIENEYWIGLIPIYLKHYPHRLNNSIKEVRESLMRMICTHELLHALGFDHVHQAECNHSRLSSENSNANDDQFELLKRAISLSGGDHLSIMLYHGLIWMEMNNPMSKGTETPLNLVMSERDKVGLNILFPPRRRPNDHNCGHYSPQQHSCRGTDLFYCFRSVMETHNRPERRICGKKCGNDKKTPSGPNCPACRTLKCKSRSYLDHGPKWQGSSGMIYCGSPCGPDFGQPCEECCELLEPQSQNQA